MRQFEDTISVFGRKFLNRELRFIISVIPPSKKLNEVQERSSDCGLNPHETEA